LISFTEVDPGLIRLGIGNMFIWYSHSVPIAFSVDDRLCVSEPRPGQRPLKHYSLIDGGGRSIVFREEPAVFDRLFESATEDLLKRLFPDD
jgi:hypothetical protein